MKLSCEAAFLFDNKGVDTYPLFEEDCEMSEDEVREYLMLQVVIKAVSGLVAVNIGPGSYTFIIGPLENRGGRTYVNGRATSTDSWPINWETWIVEESDSEGITFRLQYATMEQEHRGKTCWTFRYLDEREEIEVSQIDESILRLETLLDEKPPT